MYYRIFSKIYERAAKKMCLLCKDFIKKGDKILDLGCGSGIVGKNFQEFFQAKIIGADIKDKRIYPLSFQIIDGKSLPFPENNFDTVLLSYVLHHAGDQQSLLKEAKRVAGNKIIVFEDLSEGFFSDLICKIHGITFNYLFQENRGGVRFLNNQEWKETFNKLGLRLVFEKKLSFSLSPLQKKLFVLEKI